MRAGGAELGCLQIATALVKSGHRALVVSEGGQMVADLEAAGAEHIVMPVASKSPAAIVANARRLSALIAARNVDLIHARSRAPAWSALLAARRTGVAFVTTYHSEYSERGRLKNLYNSVMARSDRVIAVSDYMAHLIRTRYRPPESRITVIHRAFDPLKFDPGAVTEARLAAARDLIGVEAGDRVLVLAGRITPRKAQHHLVAAAGLLKQRGMTDLVLAFAGEIEKPEFRSELEAEARRLGVAHWLRFPGHVRDVAALYALATISLNISEQEGLPRAAIESQAMAVPMIVSDTGPGREVALTPPDVALEQASGLRVPYSDPVALAAAISEMLSWPDDRRRAFGRRGAEHVGRRFTLDQFTTKTLAVYREVVALKSRTGREASTPR